MSNRLKHGKRTVELHAPARPSRIRRDPVPSLEAERGATDAWWKSREWEARLAIIGIVAFALAICAVVLDIGHVLGL